MARKNPTRHLVKIMTTMMQTFNDDAFEMPPNTSLVQLIRSELMAHSAMIFVDVRDHQLLDGDDGSSWAAVDIQITIIDAMYGDEVKMSYIGQASDSGDNAYDLAFDAAVRGCLEKTFIFTNLAPAAVASDVLTVKDVEEDLVEDAAEDFAEEPVEDTVEEIVEETPESIEAGAEAEVIEEAVEEAVQETVEETPEETPEPEVVPEEAFAEDTPEDEPEEEIVVQEVEAEEVVDEEETPEEDNVSTASAESAEEVVDVVEDVVEDEAPEPEVIEDEPESEDVAEEVVDDEPVEDTPEDEPTGEASEPEEAVATDVEEDVVEDVVEDVEEEPMAASSDDSSALPENLEFDGFSKHPLWQEYWEVLSSEIAAHGYQKDNFIGQLTNTRSVEHLFWLAPEQLQAEVDYLDQLSDPNGYFENPERSPASESERFMFALQSVTDGESAKMFRDLYLERMEASLLTDVEETKLKRMVDKIMRYDATERAEYIDTVLHTER